MLYFIIASIITILLYLACIISKRKAIGLVIMGLPCIVAWTMVANYGYHHSDPVTYWVLFIGGVFMASAIAALFATAVSKLIIKRKVQNGC